MSSQNVCTGPKSKPLLSPKQLRNWLKLDEQTASYDVPNKTLKTVKHSEHQTLFCHDMKGGYLEDANNCTTENVDFAYRFYYWSLVDIFVYFSHNFVTIPPLSWITAAHRNGVSCFGTFIIEGWSEIQTAEDGKVSGKEMLLQLLEDSESVEVYAQELVNIARYYNFDGWLVNIEVSVPHEKVALLKEFISILTAGMHSMLDNDEVSVVWYDSVIFNGKNSYQNSLNVKNFDFFNCCDGIFLNYWWQPELLKRSVDYLESRKNETQNNRYRIFAGIDVHGRNTYGGGGFKCDLAVNAIQVAKVSTALFAPAWTYENFDDPMKNFTSNEKTFWSKLFPLLMPSERRIRELPIRTSFCQGFGGQSATSWFDLTKMDLQPSFCLNSTFHHHQDRFCISFQPTPNGTTEFTLFRTKILFRPNVVYCITAEYQNQNSGNLEHLLHISDRPLMDGHFTVIEVQHDAERKWKRSAVLFKLKSEEADFVVELIHFRFPPSSGEFKLGLFEFEAVQ